MSIEDYDRMADDGCPHFESDDPTQTDRVYAALQRGPITSVDFQSPTCDGGPPILRVAARINELRDRGCRIRSEVVSGSRLARYVLEAEAE